MKPINITREKQKSEYYTKCKHYKYIEDNTFIGMQAFVFNSVIEENCVIEPAAVVIGVHIPKNHYVKAGSIINSQALADALPLISEDYEYKNINKAVVNVNSQLSTTYNKKYGY